MNEKELFELWLESKKMSVKPSTLAHYRRICMKVILPHCTENGFAFDYESLCGPLYKKYEPKTMRDIISIANQVLTFGQQKGFLKDVQKISLKIPRKISKIQVITKEEQKIFTQYLLSDLDDLKFGILLSLYTGLRLGEVCGLQVKDINLRSGIICIRKTVQRISDGKTPSYHHIGPPKTDCSVRDIPLPGFLIRLLKPRIKNLPEDFYIISRSEQFVQPRTLQNRFKSYLRKCDLPEYHFHTLRHTFASRAVELGFDIKSLSEILGHSNVKITLNLYVHPSIEQKRAEMERFSALVKR